MVYLYRFSRRRLIHVYARQAEIHMSWQMLIAYNCGSSNLMPVENAVR